MNECLTFDDEDEEDHRWFFSCRNPDRDSETPVKWHEFFLLKFYSGITFPVHIMKKQGISSFSQKPDFRRTVSG
jgi:hypothetical protein